MALRRERDPHRWGYGPAALYAAILAYGSLYPFAGWLPVGDVNWPELLPASPGHLSRTDLFTNLLVYIPFGILILWGSRPSRSRFGAALLATMTGAGLSLLLESLQLLIPSRVASFVDLAANGVGTAIGAGMAVLVSPTQPLGHRLRRLRQKWIRPRVHANLGLAAIALWALTQLSPFLPSLDVGNLKSGLEPLWRTIRAPIDFDFVRTAVYYASVAGLTLLVSLFVRRWPNRALLFTGLVFGVLLLKVPVIDRQLSAEALIGSGLGLLAFVAVRKRLERRDIALTAALLILIAYAVDSLRVSEVAATGHGQTMNWIPFARNRQNLYDLADLFGSAWPGVGLAYAMLRATATARSTAVAPLGGALLAAVAVSIEWSQQWLPGRYPDITDCLVLLIGWAFAWLYASAGRRTPTEALPSG